MSWISSLFLLAGLYLVLVVVRGIVQTVLWGIDEYIVQPRELRLLEETPPKRSPHMKPKHAVAERGTEGRREEVRREGSPIQVKIVQQPRKPSRIGRSLRLLKLKLFARGYEDWVASALSEDDLVLKVEYLSRALQMNPGYSPAWGMKGYALFELERYEEAMECFDRSLELSPNASLLHKKGLCCFRVKRREEALECFRRAMEECGEQDRQLREDASRMKSLVEEELRCRGAS